LSFDSYGGERVVDGKLREPAATDAVAATIANVRDVHALIVGREVRRHDGRPHASLILVRPGRSEDPPVGEGNRAVEPSGPPWQGWLCGRPESAGSERLADGVDAQVACHLARGVTPHPVGNDEEVVVLEDGVRVLVVGALPPGIRAPNGRDED